MQGKIVLRDISFVNTIFDPLLRRRLIFLAVLFLGVTWISALVPPMVFLSFSGSSHEKIDSNSPQLPPNDASAGLGNFKQQIQVNQLYPQFAERFNSIEEVTGHIIAVDFSPSGRFLAYAGRLAERDEVVLFDMVHWKSIWRRAQFPSEIYFTHDTFPQVMSVVFSPDERYIAAASYFYGIGIWEVMNGVKVSQLNDSAIFSDPDERVHDPSFQQNILFSRDGTKIIGSGRNGIVYVWDVFTGEKLYNFAVPGGYAGEIKLSPNGSLLATGSPSGTVYLWDWADPTNVHQPISSFQGHTHQVRTLAFSPDGGLLVSGSDNGEIRFHDLSGMNDTLSPISSPGLIFSVDISPDGTILAFSNETHIILSDLMNRMTIHVIETEQSGELVFSPSGSIFASLRAHRDGFLTSNRLFLWYVASTHPKMVRWQIPDTSFNSIAFGANGTLAAASRGDGLIQLWNTTSRQKKYDLTGHTETVVASPITFSPDGRWVIAGSGNGNITFWNVSNGQNQYNLTGHSSSVFSVAFSPDGRWLASGDAYGVINLWNVTDKADMTHFANLMGHYSGVTTLAFSPDSRLLASSGSVYFNLLLWNIPSGTLNDTFYSFSRITSVAFSSDGTQLAFANWDNLVKVYYVQRALSKPVGFMASTRPRSLAFFPNELNLVTGSIDGTIQFWDPTDGTLLSTWKKHTQEVLSLKFCNTTHLISGEGDATLLFWDLDPLPADSDLDMMPDTWERDHSLNPTDFWDGFSDSDGDGLINSIECLENANPELNDSDDDSLPDLWEYIHQSDIVNEDEDGDSDRDGMSNLYEYTFSLNGFINDSFLDSDNDGLTNLAESDYPGDPINRSHDYTDPCDPDSDDDGIPDGYEYSHWRVYAGVPIGLDPLHDDSYKNLDNDPYNMTNLWEYQMGLNVSDPSDAEEDLDGDGIPNGWEFRLRLNATDKTDALKDLDGDGMSNGWEFQMGLNLTDPSDANSDEDEDGMINLLEFKHNFDANDSSDAALDADQDGISNRAECIAGTDPRDFWSFPIFSFSVIHRTAVFILLLIGFSGLVFVVYSKYNRKTLVSSLDAPDYPTAIRIRNADLPNYSTLLEAEAQAQSVCDEGITAFNQRDHGTAIKKFQSALDSFYNLESQQYIANATFRLAQIYKVQGTLTADSPLIQRFPRPPYKDPMISTFSSMLHALLAETNNNWGEAEEGWKTAVQNNDLASDLILICRQALAESAFRTWFYDQTYQNQAQLFSRLDEWQTASEAVPHKGNLCSVYLLRARLALASYRFPEVKQWLDHCLQTAEEAELDFYHELALLESERLLQHKERIEKLFEADQLLSDEDRGKILQQYVKKAVLMKEKHEKQKL